MNFEQLRSRLESPASSLGNAVASPAAAGIARRVVWAFALFSLLVWSLLAWGAHLLVSGGADLLQTQLHWFEAYAWLEPWLTGGLGITEGLMVALTWIVWAIGAMLILMGAWLLPKAFGLFGTAVAR